MTDLGDTTGGSPTDRGTGVDRLHRTRQCALRHPATFEGVGLHSGEQCRAVVHPAAADAGIVFRRVDGGESDPLRSAIAASPENVVRCDHGTTLANASGAAIATIEHLLAALAIAEIDNAFIDVEGPEIPVLDGSAAPFLAGFEKAGRKIQSAKRAAFAVNETIMVEEGDRSIRIEPDDRFSLSVEIDFEDCLIGRQSLSVTLADPDEIARLASARTFCRLYEVDALRRAGLIRGGSLDNSLVVDGERLLNRAGLRDPQEFAYHKALDLIGDLYLLGMPIQGAVRAVKPGHDINCRAALALYRQLYPIRQAAVAEA